VVKPNLVSNGVKVEYCPRAQFVKAPLILDGLSRAGKFLLGSVVASMTNVEYFQNPLLLETALYLTRLGKIDIETAKILVQTDIDFNSYNMAIGRGLNLREEDESSILNSVNPEKFLLRAKSENPKLLVEDFYRQNSLPLYISHEGICNLGILFSIYPSLNMISAQRNPISLIISWFKKGWGSRWGVDPKSFSIAFAAKGSPVPWFAVDWADEYSRLNEMDRIVKSIYSLSLMARTSYNDLSESQRLKLLFVDFDQLLKSPSKEVLKVSRFIGREPDENIAKVLLRQRLPRKETPIHSIEIENEIRNKLSLEIRPLFQELLDDYQNFWLRLVRNSDLWCES
jgi:hypothetical protein